MRVLQQYKLLNSIEVRERDAVGTIPRHSEQWTFFLMFDAF